MDERARFCHRHMAAEVKLGVSRRYGMVSCIARNPDCVLAAGDAEFVHADMRSSRHRAEYHAIIVGNDVLAPADSDDRAGRCGL